MKRALIASLVTTLFSIWGQPLLAQTTTLRLGHVGFPGSLFALTADEYAKRVNAAVKGKLEVKVFHSSQLGSDEQMMRGIKGHEHRGSQIRRLRDALPHCQSSPHEKGG